MKCCYVPLCADKSIGGDKIGENFRGSTLLHSYDLKWIIILSQGRIKPPTNDCKEYKIIFEGH
jgi:hypothetical protein